VKAYFASLTNTSIAPVDAHVKTIEEGITLLDALRAQYADHDMILRARLKLDQDYEIKFIGLGRDADQFIAELGTFGLVEGD
jgi:hypothetical protein